MKKTTFDLLDATISKKYDSNLASSVEIRERFFTEEFWLDSPNWEKYGKELESVPFNWQEFKYTDVGVGNQLKDIILSNDSGVYMFIVKPSIQIFDMPKFVLYVGIAGENNSNRPLKKRLEDYFKIESIKKRDAIIRMLEKYYQTTYVAYSCLSLSTLELKKIETSLIGFFYPLCNKDDFPIELKPVKKAF
jgi:hypothetical protein